MEKLVGNAYVQELAADLTEKHVECIMKQKLFMEKN
jgi:hypothetical protein